MIRNTHRRRTTVLLIVMCGLFGVPTLAAQPAREFTPTDLATSAAPLTESWAIDWWIPRHEAKLAARTPDVRLVLIGDSITHGWENEGKAVWDRHFGDVKTLNLGFSGDRTENVLWRLQHGEVDGLSPELVVLMIGTNNTGHRMDPPEAIAAGVGAIPGELNRRLPDAHVLLLAIFPRGESPADPQRANNREANRLLSDLASRAGVEFADFNAAFLEDSGRLGLDVMPDLLHPGPAGYEIWARQLAPYVRKHITRDRTVTPGSAAPEHR